LPHAKGIFTGDGTPDKGIANFDEIQSCWLTAEKLNIGDSIAVKERQR
jgi:hypothetical protein